jgi:hypothetical protein
LGILGEEKIWQPCWRGVLRRSSYHYLSNNLLIAFLSTEKNAKKIWTIFLKTSSLKQATVAVKPVFILKALFDKELRRVKHVCKTYHRFQIFLRV